MLLIRVLIRRLSEAALDYGLLGLGWSHGVVHTPAIQIVLLLWLVRIWSELLDWLVLLDWLGGLGWLYRLVINRCQSVGSEPV